MVLKAMKATIWHNNRCSNSRGALALLQQAGADIEVIDYLATPPDPTTLRQLLDEMGIPARDLLVDLGRRGEREVADHQG